jgi:hypothetical protein
MMVLAVFILGFDEEKAGAGEALAACVEETRVGMAMTGLLTSLPNTQLARRLVREHRQLARPFGMELRPEEIDQMTAGLNFLTRRPRLEILKEYRAALCRIYSPSSYFARARGFLQWYRGRPRSNLSTFGVAATLLSLLKLNLRYLVRPRLWMQYLRTMACGLRHSASGFARAAMASMFYLHLKRQTEFVVKQLDAQIGELETQGEAGYLRNRHYFVVEPNDPSPTCRITPAEASKKTEKRAHALHLEG